MCLNIYDELTENNMIPIRDPIAIESGIPLGSILTHIQLYRLYNVACSGGIRVNEDNNLAVIITDLSRHNLNTRNCIPYSDLFVSRNDDIDPFTLYYIGQGLRGNMNLSTTIGNTFVFESNTNNSYLIVYQKLRVNQYCYCGCFRLESTTKTIQLDINTNPREVINFKLKPLITENE